MRVQEFTEEWSQKYKSSINCSHPKGFSQRAHCAGKKKHTESVEMEMVCEECGMCETHGNHMMEVKQRLDAKCWTGKKIGNPKTKVKGGVRVNNCVPAESVAEDTQRVDSLVTDALRIMKGAEASDAVAALKTVLGDREYNGRRGHYNFYVRQLMDMYGQQGVAEGFNPEYDDEAGMAQGNLYTIAQAAQGLLDTIEDRDNLPEWVQEKIAKVEGMLVSVWNYLQSQKAQGINPQVGMSMNEQFDLIEEMVEQLAEQHGVDADQIWEDFESVDDNELYETAAWRRKEGKNKKGGLNAKGVASYRRENPGSKLQTAVTTKPSKLKPGSKAAKRRKSFCARMGGVKGPMKKPNGEPTRKALALRKWNC
jgi:hypothetical protein